MFVKGHKHSENWYKTMVGKPRPIHVRQAVSKSQKGRKHTKQEGFQKGHKPIKGTEKTRFYKGQPSWNKGTGKGTDPVKIKLSVYRSNAKRRGRKFEVTLEEMRDFLKRPCAYCLEKATGIDRIDNKEGYVSGNMLPCCGICNHMKNNLTKEDFLKKCKQIVQAVGYEV